MGDLMNKVTGTLSDALGLSEEKNVNGNFSSLTKRDLSEFEKSVTNGQVKADRISRREQSSSNKMKHGIKLMGTGISNIAKSLNSPDSKKRPRISRLPSRRSDIDIIREPDQRSLKMKGLQDRDIRGKKIK